MNEQIIESTAYERGYLKGFHDGRKWHKTEENDHIEIKLIDLWTNFCKNNVDANLSCSEQLQQMKIALEVFAKNNIQLKSCWKTFCANAVQNIANQINEEKLNLIDAMELLQELRNFLRAIYKNTQP